MRGACRWRAEGPRGPTGGFEEGTGTHPSENHSSKTQDQPLWALGEVSGISWEELKENISITILSTFLDVSMTGHEKPSA